jgi:carbonic anhydrase/acetyltransferase-like protein (isoleucine patch superfamily)
LGDVRLGAESSVWYQCVVRGDINSIIIGERTNIQDGSILHVENARCCVIGADVVVGHHVNLHACVVEDGALIGIGAIVLSGAIVRRGAVVAAGALVLEGQEIPEGSLAVGIPARVVKQLPPDTIEKHRLLCAKYVKLARLHREKKPWPPA